MIKFEDKELEELVMSKDSCIAVPIELYVNEDNELQITVYSSFNAIAEEFEAIYGSDPFNANALNWLDERFCTIVDQVEYEHCVDDIHMMCEYAIDDLSRLNKTESKAVVCADISELSGCDTDLVDDMIVDDVLAVIVDKGKVVSVACPNDVSFDDDSVELYVETDKEHRGKGYGFDVVSTLTEYYLNKGIKVRYKSAKNNIASRKIAEKCGFKKYGERYSYVCYAKEE